MAVTPTELRQLAPTQLGIRWSDGHESSFAVRNLRLKCPCANCVDEWTRERKIIETNIPQDIRPKKIESIGRYALNIQWSDGHDTGFYTFEQLRELCECEKCHKV